MKADMNEVYMRRLFPCIALLVLAADVACSTEIDVQNLDVQQVMCKANRIKWQRPPLSAIACGSIHAYRVYRDDELVSEMSRPGYRVDEGVCAPVELTAPGGSGADVNYVDELSTHVYRVNVVDANGVEHATAASYTATTSACPAGPYESHIDMTLVTFSDVLNAQCASYPCVVENLLDAPFTVEQARIDLYDGSGVSNDRPPLAWVLQQNSPDAQVTVTGTVFGWIVLGPRSSYCSAPYDLWSCGHAHDRMAADAVLARGLVANPPRIDMLHFYGTDSAPYGITDSTDTVRQIRSFSSLPQRLSAQYRLVHELGHWGLFDDVSMPLASHSFSLRCPGGVSVGPDLRDLSKDATGTPGRCLAFNYGDQDCTMGNEPRYFNAIARRSLGLLGRDKVFAIPNTTEDITLQLEHLNARSNAGKYGSSGVKMIRAELGPKPDDTAYILEYRGGPNWRELDYRAHCPDGVCDWEVPSGLARPRGVYIRLKIRNPMDLGAANQTTPDVPFSPNGSVQSLMLSREVAPGDFRPLFLDESNPYFTDTFRGLTFMLLGYEMVGGVDSAIVRVVRNPTGPVELPGD